MEPGLRAQVEGKDIVVFRDFDGFGDEAVNRIRLVPGPHHQRVETQLHARGAHRLSK